MGQVNINIKTDNDAFQNGNFGYEVARLLKEIAKDFEQTRGCKARYNDINGNQVVFIS